MDFGNYYKQARKIAKDLRPEDKHYATAKCIKGLSIKMLRTHLATAEPYESSLEQATSIVKHLVLATYPEASQNDEKTEVSLHGEDAAGCSGSSSPHGTACSSTTSV